MSTVPTTIAERAGFSSHKIAEGGKRERKRRKAWLDRQRQAGRGWAKFLFWLERSPEDAQAYRQEHEDEQGEWLIEMAANPKFKRRPKLAMPVKPKSPKPRPFPRARGMGS